MSARRRGTCPVGRLGLAALLGAAAPGAPALEHRPAAYIPDHADVVVATVRTRRSGSAAQPATLAATLEQALVSAREHLKQGRRSGDARSAGYAEAALAPWWGTRDAPAELALVRAALKARRHAFAEARTELMELLEREPGDPRALLSLGLLLQATGDIGASAERCRELLRARPGPSAATCLGLAESLSGEAERGYARIAAALQVTRGIDRETFAWSLSALAEIADRLGHPDRARALLERAHELAPDDDAVLAALADQHLTRGAYARVMALLAPFAGRDRQLVRLVIAAVRAGDPRAAAWKDALEAGLAASRRRGEPQLVAEALYRLEVEGTPARAAELALAAWEEERTAENTWLAIRAARAAGRPVPAPVERWLSESGLVDSRFAANREGS